MTRFLRSLLLAACVLWDAMDYLDDFPPTEI
jgi:hypothetical protein